MIDIIKQNIVKILHIVGVATMVVGFFVGIFTYNFIGFIVSFAGGFAGGLVYFTLAKIVENQEKIIDKLNGTPDLAAKDSSGRAPKE